MIGDQWIYVGKANNSLHERIRAHAKEEKFQPYLGSCKISYFEFEHASDMTHAEAALIKIQKPVLNASGKNDSRFPFSVDSDALQWVEYKTPQEIKEEKKKKAEEEKERKRQQRELDKKWGMLNDKMEELRRWNYLYMDYVETEQCARWAEEIFDQISKCFGRPCDQIRIRLSYPVNKKLDYIKSLKRYTSENQYLYEIVDDGNAIYLLAPVKNAIQIVRKWSFAEAAMVVSSASRYRFEEIQRKYNLTSDEMIALYEITKEELAACA